MSSIVQVVEAPKLQSFGVAWPDLNDGLTYTDLLKPSTITASTLIEFYTIKHKTSAPYHGWLQRISNGQITIDGQIVTNPDTILGAGSEVVYHRLPWEEPEAPYLLEVLFEDDDLVALNKPSGLQVLPGGLFQQRTVLTQLQWRTRRPSSSGTNGVQEAHPVPVHRLGRGTSGILLCAKTKLAKTRLAAYFADGTSVVGKKNTDPDLGTVRKISKIYRALATGIIDKDEVVIKQPIGTMRYPGVAKGLYIASSSGKPSLSKVNVLERHVQGNNTLVQVEIQSGRPHQIRIHLSFIGHPLFGDPLYVAGGHPNCIDPESVDSSFAQDGGYQRPMRPVPGDCGYYLHAHRMVLHHPTSSEGVGKMLLGISDEAEMLSIQGLEEGLIDVAKMEVIEITAPLPSILQTQEEASQRNCV